MLVGASHSESIHNSTSGQFILYMIVEIEHVEYETTFRVCPGLGMDVEGWNLHARNLRNLRTSYIHKSKNMRVVPFYVQWFASM